MTRIEPFNPGFSTADAEYPEIHAAAGSLHLTFKDWREQIVHVEFTEVCAFRWQEAESLLPNEPFDGSCELLESPWLAEHVEQGIILLQGSQYRHLRFNFNACGQLQVLCVSYYVQT